ncbi:site-specific integrase [Paenibacillus sp. MY03]|uniref:site-specific integrase n=1 Tax=Paenibacillus sp. MY03 TaxID=302980 RepID=UPI000B3C69D9|nr:site-specific integrase [Paenibacillus sp. MY03]OUS72994.1 site-specific integrase [Paenibacillus sp. MY03]
MQFVQPIRDPEKIEQMKQLLLSRSKRDWFIFVFGINTGLRIGDILRLKVKDVRNRTHISLIEGKTRKKKWVPINSELKRVIDDYTKGMKADATLFPSYRTRGETGICRVQAYRILNWAADQCGLEEIGTHTLRKTFGYHFYQKTKDVAMLQNIFNHAYPSLTMRYIGINQDMIDEAVSNFAL